MAKLKGVKFVGQIEGKDKATVAGATEELMAKIEQKFPVVLSVGKGKDKVSVTVEALFG